MYTLDQEGRVHFTEDFVSNMNRKTLAAPNVEILIPVNESDIFTPVIHDNIIITRTKKYEDIYYRILMLLDDRLTVGDMLSIMSYRCNKAKHQNDVLVCLDTL